MFPVTVSALGINEFPVCVFETRCALRFREVVFVNAGRIWVWKVMMRDHPRGINQR